MKRKILFLITCVMVILSTGPVFSAGSSEYSSPAGDELWVDAGVIVNASSSILPLEKKVVWEDLDPNGEAVSQQEITLWYGEESESGTKLKVEYAGDSAVFDKRAAVNDGLLSTPFDGSADTKINNTGTSETVNGNDCTVFRYVSYSEEDLFNSDSEIILDLPGPAVNSRSNEQLVKTEGKAWIDGSGVLRKLESNRNLNGIDYCETVSYDYDGTNIFPVESVLEGTTSVVSRDLIVQTSFRATEEMNGYWVASDF